MLLLLHLRLHLEDSRAGALAVGHPSGRRKVHGLGAVRRGRAEAVLDATLDAVLVRLPKLSGQHAPRQAAVDLVRVRARGRGGGGIRVRVSVRVSGAP